MSNFGHDSRFLNNGTDSSRGNDQEDQNGSKESQGLISLDLMRAILPNRKDEINGTGHTPGSFVLSQPSVRLVSSLSNGESVLRCTMAPNGSTKQSRASKNTHEFFFF